ncbi:hypothetical protein Ctob_008945 [Chrysochromulina tobinii]|uniref:Uncharacterized protein n=1 Tax=Chrysochromulina tobinii TaxID=1460289 RepID=A0A0M0J917_9EUKA|nr:hypothetical protein Ctob_008945 [Chrysochromulina tobinii]|eukprot:KOO23076.1 hypothetical protein Ctob_008945 [Chrysochromulina sp. CCMP291]
MISQRSRKSEWHFNRTPTYVRKATCEELYINGSDVYEGGFSKLNDEPWASHGEEVGFVYQDMNSHAELLHEKAEILATRTEAAGARFARNLLRASVQRLVDKRRLVATELRRMENERVSLSTQLALLHQQAADAFGELPDQIDPVYATMQLLDEAEARHAERLAERRKAHLSTVGTLQTEYIGALRDIRNEAVRTSYEPHRAHDPIATLATNDSAAWPTGSPNPTLAERYNALQRQVFVLETQLQQHRDAILQRDAALAEAESQVLKCRGLALVADERAVAAERRAAEAETMSKATRSELGRTREELQALRKVSEGQGRSIEAWNAEREGLLRAAAEAEDRWNREAAVARIEHERAMRSLEEDLAFETASPCGFTALLLQPMVPAWNVARTLASEYERQECLQINLDVLDDDEMRPL